MAHVFPLFRPLPLLFWDLFIHSTCELHPWSRAFYPIKERRRRGPREAKDPYKKEGDDES